LKRIIVEGMDSTGKTTLIESLRQQFHFLDPVRNDLGPEQDFDHWWPAVMDTHYHGLIPIHDRFFYSELIYGIVLRGYVKASTPIIISIRQMLRAEAFLIYCRPSESEIESTIDNKPQMEGVIYRRERLLREYDALMVTEARHYGERFIRYDYRTSDRKELITRTEEYLLGTEQTWIPTITT
jgi:hypothetical protein